jgi:hypothetical protein
MSAHDSLPDDVATLKQLLLASNAELAQARAEASSTEALVMHLRLTIEKLKRDLFGARNERKARLIDQMELALEELEAAATEDEVAAEKTAAATQVRAFTRRRPARKPFPAHLPRERVIVPGPTARRCLLLLFFAAIAPARIRFAGMRSLFFPALSQECNSARRASSKSDGDPPCCVRAPSSPMVKR